MTTKLFCPRSSSQPAITVEEIREKFACFTNPRAFGYALWLLEQLVILQAQLDSYAFTVREWHKRRPEYLQRLARLQQGFDEMTIQIAKSEERFTSELNEIEKRLANDGEFLPEIAWVRPVAAVVSPRPCAFCGNEFIGQSPRSKYCSRDCFHASRAKGPASEDL